MEMGNGERVIITADEFPYKYDKAGTYTLELKTITRGLISTIATKEIKVVTKVVAIETMKHF